MMQERWLQLWQKLNCEPPLGVGEQLWGLYTSPDRHYHNLTHIQECLKLLELMPTPYPEAIELAIWFHDAVYNTRAADNEQQSANLATATIQQAGLSAELANKVHQLILATSHQHQAIDDHDTQLLIDIDLAILGSDPDTFKVYESNIRQEYVWVPLTTFQQKRAEILQEFLDRLAIYQTTAYWEMFEAPARRNLAKSIAQLAKR
jgi:predicted metal-dependent HD superfamily phosphohydrolase